MGCGRRLSRIVLGASATLRRGAAVCSEAECTKARGSIGHGAYGAGSPVERLEPARCFARRRCRWRRWRAKERVDGGPGAPPADEAKACVRCGGCVGGASRSPLVPAVHWVPARVVEDNLPALRARDRGALESILERYPRPTSARQRPQPWKAAVAASSPAGAAPASTQAGTAGPRRGRQVGGAPTGAAAPSAAAVAGHSTHYRDQNAINADVRARAGHPPQRQGGGERGAAEGARGAP